MEIQESVATSLEMSVMNSPAYSKHHVASELSLIAPEEWALYSSLNLQLSVSVPLQELTVASLQQLKLGAILCSLWPVSEDVSLFVEDIFLANVCFEPSGASLAVRISDFAPRGSTIGARGLLLGKTAADVSEHDGILNALKVNTLLRFGVAQVELGQVSGFATGHTIVLNRSVNAAVEIIARGYVVATGLLVLVGGYYAVQITKTANIARELPPC